MKMLSPKQQKVYRKLIEIWQRSGNLPEVADLARELGLHYVSLRQHLQALDKKGYLRFRSRGVGKAPYLSLPRGAGGIPVVGSIPAGPLSEAFEDIEGYLPLRGKTGYFALRVSGDSMADLIQDQDVVLLEKDVTPRAGEICAVRVQESEVTLKYLDVSRNATEVILRPHNPRYSALTVAAGDVHIEGVYRGLLRGDVVFALYEV